MTDAHKEKSKNMIPICRDETPSDSALHETDSTSTEYREGASSDSSPQDTDTSSVEYLADASLDPELRESGAAARLPEEDGLYTYADYCTWDDDTRWELLDGIAYAMSAPTAAHQDICGMLYLQIGNYLLGKPCKVYFAPFDVRLFANMADDSDETDTTVVQPDLLVVCDRSKLSDGRSCKGAPDLVVEILSPSTASKDRMTKLQKYREAGVREYWIVDPDERTVLVYLFEGGKFIRANYGEIDKIPVTVLPGLSISLPDVFAEI